MGNPIDHNDPVSDATQAFGRHESLIPEALEHYCGERAGGFESRCSTIGEWGEKKTYTQPQWGETCVIQTLATVERSFFTYECCVSVTTAQPQAVCSVFKQEWEERKLLVTTTSRPNDAFPPVPTTTDVGGWTFLLGCVDTSTPEVPDARYLGDSPHHDRDEAVCFHCRRPPDNQDLSEWKDPHKTFTPFDFYDTVFSDEKVNIHIYVQTDLKGDPSVFANLVFAQTHNCGKAVCNFLDFQQESPPSDFNIVVGIYPELLGIKGLVSGGGTIAYNASPVSIKEPLPQNWECTNNTIAHELTHRLRLLGALRNLEDHKPVSKVLEEGLATFVAREVTKKNEVTPPAELLGSIPVDMEAILAATSKVYDCYENPPPECSQQDDFNDFALCCAKENLGPPHQVKLQSIVDGSILEQGIYILYDQEDGLVGLTLLDAGTGNMMSNYFVTDTEGDMIEHCFSVTPGLWLKDSFGIQNVCLDQGLLLFLDQMPTKDVFHPDLAQGGYTESEEGSYRDPEGQIHPLVIHTQFTPFGVDIKGNFIGEKGYMTGSAFWEVEWKKPGGKARVRQVVDDLEKLDNATTSCQKVDLLSRIAPALGLSEEELVEELQSMKIPVDVYQDQTILPLCQ